MDKFHKKNIIEQKKEFELATVDEFADFQGSKAELLFLKFTRTLGRHKKWVFIGLGSLVILLSIVIGFFEYREHLFQKETVTLEDLKEKQKQTKAGLAVQIQSLESFLADQTTGKMELRVWKDLSRLQAETGNYPKAAEYLELAGKSIDSPKEIKALYFYIAGNYREQANDLTKAAENYKIAAVVVEPSRELDGFKSWAYYQAGRLAYATGNKEEARTFLQKCIRLETKESENEVQLNASYLLLKLGRG